MMQREIDRKNNAISTLPAVNAEDPDKEIYEALKVISFILYWAFSLSN